MPQDSEFNFPRFTYSDAIFFLILGNLILFFVLAIFFDGGAFPYGEIRDDEFWIVNNDGARNVSEAWFRFTFWQGSLSWFCLGMFLLCVLVARLVRSIREKSLKDAASSFLWSIGGVLWVSWVVLEAVSIVSDAL